MLYLTIYLLGCVLSYGFMYAFWDNEFRIMTSIDNKDKTMFITNSVFSWFTIICYIIIAYAVDRKWFLKHGIKFIDSKY